MSRRPAFIRRQVRHELPYKVTLPLLNEVKRLTMITISQYNGWRFEDVWLDK